MNWYIDRSRNINSIFTSDWYEKLVEVAKKEESIDKYKNNSNKLCEELGIGGKNPFAVLTFLRDIGLIDDNNNATDFFKSCLNSNITNDKIILLILLKRNEIKDGASNIKPFVVLCKTLCLMKKLNKELKINWYQCINYLMEIESYKEINELLINKMCNDNNPNPDNGPDIWFNALLATKLFTGRNNEIKVDDAYYDFIEYIANYGHEMNPSLNRDEYLSQASSDTYGLFEIFKKHTYEGVVKSKTVKDFIPYIEYVDKNSSNRKINQLPFRNKNKYKAIGMNTILYGAPGTGKTYSTPEYAIAIIENENYEYIHNKYSNNRNDLLDLYNKYLNEGRIAFTTFHQSFGYEDFIQGLKPDVHSQDIRFAYADGIFKQIADKAMQSDDNYVVIIDEINRGNISRIFGELITLIESDKRWGENEQLSVVLPSGEKFAVPNNLYILGTMNTADKSISLVDVALRRRFDFVEMTPKTELVNIEFRKFLDAINGYLIKELRNKDLLIGHSYFMNRTVDQFADIVNQNVIPLLYEYFFDDETKVKKALDAVAIPLYVDSNGNEYVYEAKPISSTGRIKYKVIPKPASSINENND